MDYFDAPIGDAIEESSTSFVPQDGSQSDIDRADRVHYLELQNRLLFGLLRDLNKENKRLLREYEKLEKSLTAILLDTI